LAEKIFEPKSLGQKGTHKSPVGEYPVYLERINVGNISAWKYTGGVDDNNTQKSF